MTGVSGAPTQDDPPEALSGTPSMLGRLLRLDQNWKDRRVQRREAALYGECETLADLGEVTALWAEGEISYHPGGYDEGPAEETVELIPALATLNRAGFVTSGSQPGEPAEVGYDGRVWWMRAAVDGFTDPETADRLEAACTEANLIFIRNGPARWRSHWKNAVPVTVKADSDLTDDPPHVTLLNTHFGAHLSRRYVKFIFNGYLSRELCKAEQVTVIDPVWGRQNVLWDTLTAAVTPPERHNPLWDIQARRNPPCCPCNERKAP